MKNPSIGLIEIASIAKGYFVLDQMLKKAPVDVLLSKTVSPGKYVILISSDVASTEESMRMALDVVSPFLVDSLFIPQIHPDVLSGIKENYRKQKMDSVLIVETATVSSTIVALDQGLKGADVTLLELKLGQGLGGKGYFVLTGDLSAVQASLAGVKNILSDEKLLHSEVIARPHEEFDFRRIE